jgi:hypothetical protein
MTAGSNMPALSSIIWESEFMLTADCRANGSSLSLVHYMRKALISADPSVLADIDALKDIVSTINKSSLGTLSESLRSCQASVSFTEAFINQLRQVPNDSDHTFLQRAQQFLDSAQSQAIAAQVAITEATESFQTMMSFFGVDMKSPKVHLLSARKFCFVTSGTRVIFV